jgi:DNA-binding NtrC family response regulator
LSDDIYKDDDSTLTAVLRSDASKRGRLRLLVVGDGIYATHPLPEAGDLTIGRSDKADVCIDDPLISRKHAVLHLGPRIQLEDLGSSNGLRVRDIRVDARQTVDIFPGDAIDIGSTTLIVQNSSAALRPRRLWTHGAFEARLEDECARAERSSSQFAVVRIHIEGNLASAAVQDVLGLELRSVDVVATYGPDEYEVLLVDTPTDRATEVARRLTARLVDRGARIRVGIACHPRDGTAPEEIVARACAAVRGGDEGVTSAIVLQDGAMQRLHKLVKRIAVGTISVLLLGETGVGKEVLAETIHRESPRAGKPFLRLNCAALSETLLESELFGHERGAFTGAVQAKPGLLETAQAGTVFLDEVGELPMTIQVKLLRVIEERQVYRVGSVKPRPIDVRFVAATNRDLEAEVAFGAFRQDLFFRLNGISLVIPPLRERVDEIEGLARAFITQVVTQGRRGEPARPAARRGPEVSPEAMSLLKRYSWPGNIRELRNLIERAVLLCGDGPITLEHLPVDKMGATLPGRPNLRSAPPPGSTGPALSPGTLLPGRLGGARPTRWGASGPSSEPPTARAPRAPGPSAAYAEVLRSRGYDTRMDEPQSTFSDDVAGGGPVSERGSHLEAARGGDMAEGDRFALGYGLGPPPIGRSKIGEAERARILEALERCAGNQTKAARLLGMSRRTLVARLETYALPRPRKGSP